MILYTIFAFSEQPWGQDKEILTTASKTRIDILGAINLDDMSIVAKEYESNINSTSVVDFCNEVKENYADKQLKF